ncbi:acyl carrier protein [Streptomyces sp. NPDC048595]|uniref:acyl carrier protein n=1 Tax=Streptomyces sp. NPDC048595 TaxID=3365576 RepID=UPI0037156884
MTTSHPAVTEEQARQLREIVIDVLELAPEELTETSHFVNDHEADSLLAIEILARIEQDLDVEIPQDQLPEMVNLTGVRDVFARNQKGADQ